MLALPRWAHIPGETDGADDAPLEAAKALVPERFGVAAPAEHPAFLYGVALCNAGFYWEAHEVWEAVWMATTQNGRDRQAVRGLIQLANAGLKLRMGKARAALRLLEEASFRLEDAAGPGSGDGVADRLPCRALVLDIETLVRRLADGRETAALPRIALLPGR